MKLTDSSAANVGATAVTAIASSTALFRHFMVYAATTLSSVISGMIGLVKNGNGTLTLNAANTFTGAVVVNAGTLATGSAGLLADTANVTINSGGNYTVGAVDTIASISGSGSLTLGDNLTIGNSTFNGNILGTSKIVTSGTLTFSGNNSSWTGGMSVLNGAILIAGSDNAFGTGILAGGNSFVATIRSSDATARTLGNTISRTASAGGTLTFGSVGTGNLTFQGGYFNSVGILSTIAVLNAQTQLNGGISSTSTGVFTKTGSGKLILNANNTYIASTFIVEGTLEIGASGRLGSGNYTGQIAITGLTSGFIYSGTNNQTLSGIISGTGALTKNGTGTLTLTGANTYTGATSISAGSIIVQKTIGASTATATFSATLSVSFNVSPPSGTTTFRFFSGATTNSYASVTLVGVPVGTTATYASATSTLSVTVP